MTIDFNEFAKMSNALASSIPATLDDNRKLNAYITGESGDVDINFGNLKALKILKDSFDPTSKTYAVDMQNISELEQEETLYFRQAALALKDKSEKGQMLRDRLGHGTGAVQKLAHILKIKADETEVSNLLNKGVENVVNARKSHKVIPTAFQP